MKSKIDRARKIIATKSKIHKKNCNNNKNAINNNKIHNKKIYVYYMEKKYNMKLIY